MRIGLGKQSFPFCLDGMELTNRELCDALEEFERTVVDTSGFSRYWKTASTTRVDELGAI